MKYFIAPFRVGWVHLVHWVSEACLLLWNKIKTCQQALLSAPFLQHFKKSEAHVTIYFRLGCCLVHKCLFFFSFYESNERGCYSHSLLYFPEGSSQLFSIRCGGCPLKQRGGHRGWARCEPLCTCRDVVSVRHAAPLSALNRSVFHQSSVQSNQ